MKQILIVEDDRELNSGLCSALKEADRKLISCLNLKSAREQLTIGGTSLVLLDENLPDGSGLDLLREIKKSCKNIKVIMITANDTDPDIVEGLESGADDYITKPFSLAVLRARVSTQLRNVSDAAADDRAGKVLGGKVSAGLNDEYLFDFEKMIFLRGNEKIELSKTEQKLLRILIENKGSVVKRATLVDRIWTDGAEYVDENALSVSVKRLRDKLQAQEYIKTVYGLGYSWETVVKCKK